MTPDPRWSREARYEYDERIGILTDGQRDPTDMERQIAFDQAVARDKLEKGIEEELKL